MDSKQKIAELSKSTLGSYIKKASQDKADMANTTGFRAGVKEPAYNTSDESDKEKKRMTGISRAANKLTKEEAKLDEATPTAQQVKQGIGIARDKRYAKGNVTGAVRAMNKVNPGLAQHPAVKKELQKQNEDVVSKYLAIEQNGNLPVGHEYEFDYEGDMAKTQLNMMMDAASELKAMLKNDTNLPEWVQSKITKAADYIDSARDYMKNMNRDQNGNMHNEPMGEAKERDLPFKADEPKQVAKAGKFGAGYSTARHLARQAMQNVMKDIKRGPEKGKRQVS